MLRKAEQLYLDRLFKPIGKFFKPGMHILDAGCGIGKDAEYLNRLGCRVSAIDLVCQPAHWPALSDLGIVTHEASAEALPFADATFDAVWAKDALHHMQNPLQALREFMRVVKPGGPVFLIEANRYNPLFYLHLTLLGNHQHFSRRRFRAMLDQIDPQHTLFLAESRCLPWDAAWLLSCQEKISDFMERRRFFHPWLTYHIAVMKGKSPSCTSS